MEDKPIIFPANKLMMLLAYVLAPGVFTILLVELPAVMRSGHVAAFGIMLLMAIWLIYLFSIAVLPSTIVAESKGITAFVFGFPAKRILWSEIEKIIKIVSTNGVTNSTNYHLLGKGGRVWKPSLLTQRISFSGDAGQKGLIELKAFIEAEARRIGIAIYSEDTTLRKRKDGKTLKVSLEKVDSL